MAQLLRGRTPKQARALARVEAILDAAGAELVAHGLPINLTDVAADAGVPIGSLYQYFPGHAALVRGLAERHLRSVGQAIVADVADVGIGPGTTESALRDYLATADDPLQVAIMHAIRADESLRELDRADTAANVERLVVAMEARGRPVGERDRDRLELTIDLAGEMVLLLSTRDAGDRPRLTEEFIAMVTAR